MIGISLPTLLHFTLLFLRFPTYQGYFNNIISSWRLHVYRGSLMGPHSQIQLLTVWVAGGKSNFHSSRNRTRCLWLTELTTTWLSYLQCIRLSVKECNWKGKLRFNNCYTKKPILTNNNFFLFVMTFIWFIISCLSCCILTDTRP